MHGNENEKLNAYRDKIRKIPQKSCGESVIFLNRFLGGLGVRETMVQTQKLPLKNIYGTLITINKKRSKFFLVPQVPLRFRRSEPRMVLYVPRFLKILW